MAASCLLCFSFLVHLGTFSCAFLAGFYAYPFLSPTLNTHSVPRYGKLALRTQLTILPLPFLVLNLLLAALYVRSRTMLLQAGKQGLEDAAIDMVMNELSNLAESPPLQTSNDYSFSADTDFFYNASSADINQVDHQQLETQTLQAAQRGDEGAGIKMVMNELTNLAESAPTKMSDTDSFSTDTDFSSSTDISQVDHQRLETQKRSAKNQPRRLTRSRSDGALLSLMTAGKSPWHLRAIAPLSNKARNLESAWHRRRRRRVKPVVVVADPPEDGQLAEAEVDKKAEEFIGRFYQRMRASRRS